MHFASPFDLLANSLWEIALPIPFAPRKRRSLRVGTHLASDKDATTGDFHDFLVSHCPNHRHSGSPYLVLRTFNPSALAIPEFFPPDLLDPCSNGAVVVVHQIRGRFLRAAKTTKFRRYAVRSAFNRSRISVNSFSSAEGPFGGAGLRKRLTCWITTNRTSAIIRNSITVFKNAP